MSRRLLAGALVLALAGCAAPAPQASTPTSAGATEVNAQRIKPLATPTPALPVTVDSVDGRRITVTDVSRIIPLAGSISEVVFTLGLGANVVGRDVAATFEPARALPVVTSGHDVSAESTLSLRPTVILTEPGVGPPEALSQLRDSGVPVVVLPEAKRMADTYTRIEAVAAALGVPGAGRELAERTKGEVDAARATLPQGQRKARVAFLYLRGQAAVYLLGGKGSGADSIIDAAGASDVGMELGLGPFTPLTAEALVKAQPDVFLVMSKGLDSVQGVDGLLKLPGVAQTPAAANRRVVAIEDGVLLNFGPRTALVVTALAEGLR
ncbi:heme/hemin ABC transporter substrate-binding protein [Crossiella cryophila]|uniref:Iron complex transport system substrate-binding protein n=1 Tax=Crossiella cryophila TaxID=43355 RepID=A0A7W7C913_9PSEU|nr:ABC transporter substrate-binding protein [Crossiella cryophila]MBB4675513.1 iron complex transport system substrate-binding protein [Crossiella cryophila]